MAKAKLKTTASTISVDAFVDAIQDEAQRADVRIIAAMMERLSGQPPKMWGPSIIGFGRYHYTYESGREGEMCRIGLSPRKGNTVLYLSDGFGGYSGLLQNLGKHKTGKSCLYIKRLEDVELAVLESLCEASLRSMAERYPDGA